MGEHLSRTCVLLAEVHRFCPPRIQLKGSQEHVNVKDLMNPGRATVSQLAILDKVGICDLIQNETVSCVLKNASLLMGSALLSA